MSEIDAKPMLVWWFSEAPEAYRNLSVCGGDEDWLAFVPFCPPEKYDDPDKEDAPVGARINRDMESLFRTPYVPWAERGTPFGVCHVDTFRVEGGWVLIGCHS